MNENNVISIELQTLNDLELNKKISNILKKVNRIDNGVRIRVCKSIKKLCVKHISIVDFFGDRRLLEINNIVKLKDLLINLIKLKNERIT
jgi:hypothetical protein